MYMKRNCADLKEREGKGWSGLVFSLTLARQNEKVFWFSWREHEHELNLALKHELEHELELDHVLQSHNVHVHLPYLKSTQRARVLK